MNDYELIKSIESGNEKVKYNIYYIKANPNNGFNFGYILGLPQNMQLFVESNNDEKSNSNHEFIKEAMDIMEERIYILRRQKAPIMIPIIPSKKDKPYYQQLTREALEETEGKYERIDLQLLNAIKDSKRKTATITKKNLKEKIFLSGYSSSGVFAQRFALLHPEIIDCVCIGGAAGSIPIPLETYNGVDLPYPIGAKDFKQMTGSEFNSEAYIKIKFAYYIGELEADKLGNWDVEGNLITRDKETGKITNAVQVPAPMHDMSYNGRSIPKKFGYMQREALGQGLWDRWNNCIEVYKKLGYIIGSKIYEGKNHSNAMMPKDIDNFYRDRSGFEFKNLSLQSLEKTSKFSTNKIRTCMSNYKETENLLKEIFKYATKQKQQDTHTIIR